MVTVCTLTPSPLKKSLVIQLVPPNGELLSAQVTFLAVPVRENPGPRF